MPKSKTHTEQNQSLARSPQNEEQQTQRKDNPLLSTLKKVIRVYEFIERWRGIYEAINFIVTLLGKYGFWSWLGATLSATNPLFFLCAFPLLFVVLFWMMDRQIRKGAEGGDSSK